MAKRQYLFGIIAVVVVWMVVVSASMTRMTGVENRMGTQIVMSPIDRWDSDWNVKNKNNNKQVIKRKKPTTKASTPTPKPTTKASTPTPTLPKATEHSDSTSRDDVVKEQSEGTQKTIPDEHLLRTLPVDLTDTTVLDKCTKTFSDSDHNINWTKKLTKFFHEEGIHWWLDEGGLIGASRAGSMSNADDDYDFFALIPNQRNPCRPDSPTCSKEEFNTMIHSFLLKLWNFGFCINNFDPNLSKFNSKSKLMYSLMLNQDKIYQPGAKTPGARCFEHGKSPRFAHMHLAMLTEEGKLATNLWAPLLKNGGHAHDFIPLSVVLPTTRCRTGKLEAPCPQDIAKFLKLRNEGEYAKASSQGNCLLVRRKWSVEKKEKVMQLTKDLHECGYNSMFDLINPAIASDFMTC